MLAHIIVDNRTGHAIHAEGCGQLFELALGNSSHPALSGWPACLETLTIAVGKSSYPWTIRASYDDCGGVGAGVHACLPHNQPPPLPAGEYDVVFCQNPYIVSAPAPIPVRLTSRPLHPALPNRESHGRLIAALEPARCRGRRPPGSRPRCTAG